MDNQNWSHIFPFWNSTSIWKCCHSFGICLVAPVQAPPATPQLPWHHGSASLWVAVTVLILHWGKMCPPQGDALKERNRHLRNLKFMFSETFTSSDALDSKIWSFDRKLRVFWGIGVGLVRKSQHFLQKVDTCCKSWKVKFPPQTSF